MSCKVTQTSVGSFIICCSGSWKWGWQGGAEGVGRCSEGKSGVTRTSQACLEQDQLRGYSCRCRRQLCLMCCCCHLEILEICEQSALCFSLKFHKLRSSSHLWGCKFYRILATCSLLSDGNMPLYGSWILTGVHSLFFLLETVGLCMLVLTFS